MSGTKSRIKIKSKDRRPLVNGEIVMNQPTDACENVTNEPTLAAAVGLESPTYMKASGQNATNEPTDACEIVTNEPTLAGVTLESRWKAG